MARPLRIEYEGALYHVTSRGNERGSIFRDIADRRKFLSIIGEAHDRYKILIYSYVLMNNHYHLMIMTPKANLARVMHYINGSYTAYFNFRYKRAGHLFQGRYKGILVDKDAYLLELSRYIHLNPVRTGDVDYPEDYKWSSYQFFESKGLQGPGWLNIHYIYELLSNDRSKSRARYVQFVKEGLKKPVPSPLERVFAQSVLGNERFRAKIKEKVKNRKDPEVPALARMSGSGQTPESIIRLVTGFFGVPKEVVALKGKKFNAPRLAAIYLCRKYSSSSLANISGHFGGIVYSAVTQSMKRVEQRMKDDREFAGKVRAVEKTLSMPEKGIL